MGECSRDQLIAHLGSGAAEIARMMPELRELVPAMPDVPLSQFEKARFQLFEAVSSFVHRVAVERPLVFVLDDLHVADETSLMLLSFLAGTVPDSRVLLIGTYRDTAVPTSHPLGAWFAELTRNRRCLRLALRGLTPDDVTHLVELIAGAAPLPRLAAAIHRMSEGNPLFVTELVRLLGAQGKLRELGPGEELPTPQGIAEVIARHAALLSQDCQETLAIASVIGREFDPDVVSEITDVGSAGVRDRCDEAAAARLIEESPDRRGCVRFVHALVRNTLYDQLPPAERARLHGAIGDALERRGSPVTDARTSELAHHFLQAAREGWATKAIEYAQRAAGVLAYEEAARVYGMALDVAETSSAIDDRQHAGIVVSLAEQVIRDGGELVRVRADLPQIVRVVARGRHPDLAARAAVITCLRDMFEGRRFDKAPIDWAIAFFRGNGDLGGEARAWWALSLIHRELGEVGAGGEAATRSLDCARRAGDRALASQALQGLAFSLLFGPVHVEQVIPRLRRLREDAGTASTEAVVLGCLGHAEAIAGNYFEAREAAERSRGILVDMQHLLDVARLDVFNRSEIERWAHDLASAERIARGACRVMEEYGAVGLLASALSFLAEILIAEGRTDEGHEVVARAATHLTEADVDARWRQARARARIELSADHIAVAEGLAFHSARPRA